MDINHNIILGSDITLSCNHMFSGATPSEIGYLHNAHGNIQDQLDALDTDTTTLNEDVTSMGTTLAVVGREITALQTEMVGLGVATVANGLFLFTNAVGTLVSSTVLSSRLTNYLPLSGGTLTGSLNSTSGSFTSLTVGGNSVVTATALNPVVTASGMTSVLAGYLPLAGGTLTGNLTCKQLTCTSEVDTGSLSCSNLTVNGTVSLPSTSVYGTVIPSNCLGNFVQSARTALGTLDANAFSVMHSINISQGVWLLQGMTVAML